MKVDQARLKHISLALILSLGSLKVCAADPWALGGKLAPEGVLKMTVQGQPMALAKFESDQSLAQVLEQWTTLFSEFEPVQTHQGRWTMLGAPVGPNWMGLQVQQIAGRTLGWQVVIPLDDQHRQPVIVEPWPAFIALQGQWQSEQNGQLHTTLAGEMHGSLGAVASRVRQYLQAKGYHLAPESVLMQKVLGQQAQSGAARKQHEVLQFPRVGLGQPA